MPHPITGHSAWGESGLGKTSTSSSSHGWCMGPGAAGSAAAAAAGEVDGLTGSAADPGVGGESGPEESISESAAGLEVVVCSLPSRWQHNHRQGSTSAKIEVEYI